MHALIRLAARRDTEDVLADVRTYLAGVPMRNVFNPSIVMSSGELHIAFRAFGPAGTKPFHAYLARRGANGEWSCRSLTDEFGSHGVSVVADPKLFVHDDRVWVTFNTGTPTEGPNQVYVAEVSPSLGPAHACQLDGRARIEKNWGFFEGARGLSAVYSIAPLVILDQVPAGRPGELTFSRRHLAETGLPFALDRRLTVGTQPLAEGGRLRLIGHEKIWVAWKRAYVGRPVIIDGVDTERPTTRVARVRLVHTLRDAVPRARPVHNPNLLSATYFAGLTRGERSYLVSYGVNDVASGVADVEGALWPR